VEIEKRRSKILRKRWIKIVLIVLILIVFFAAGFFIYNRWQNSRQILSASLKKDISYSVFWPNKYAPVSVNRDTLKYDKVNSIFSYIAKTPSGSNLTVTEQATPDSFAASPIVFSQLIKDLIQYEEFSSRSGTIYITTPKELKGGQAAVMNSQGTLMFVKPTKNLSEATWRQFFNNLDIIN
jgi:hypothetical protein